MRSARHLHNPTGASRSVDDVDRQRIRTGLSAFGAVVGGGTGFVVALQYISFVCTPHCQDAAPMFGLLAAWAAIGAVAGGLWGWHRDVPTGTVAAAFLAFMALHFVSPATWSLYGPLLDSALAMGSSAGPAGTTAAFLVYWTLAAALGVALVWQGGKGLARLLARWEIGELPPV